jgi:hypothetical protein
VWCVLVKWCCRVVVGACVMSRHARAGPHAWAENFALLVSSRVVQVHMMQNCRLLRGLGATGFHTLMTSSFLCAPARAHAVMVHPRRARALRGLDSHGDVIGAIKGPGVSFKRL